MSFQMKNAFARRALAAAAIPLFSLLATVAHADWGGLNMREGVTILSKKIYGLHMTIFYWCIFLAVVVFGVMIYSLVKFRKSQGAKADTTLVHSTKVEIVWTIIPICILVAMAVPTAKALIEIEDMATSSSTSRSRATSGSGNTSTSVRRSASSPRSSATATRRGSSTRASTRRPFPTTCSTWTTRWSSPRARRSASCSPRRTSSTPGGCRTSA